MSEDTLTTVAVIAGLLQALGYATYIWKSLKGEVDPNPTTWLMFAYGTTFLTILEWDQNAKWQLLILPCVCAVLSLGVAYLCWKRGTLRWPEDRTGRVSIFIDLTLTVGYIATAILSMNGSLDQSQRTALVIAFLALSNASTAVSFAPMFKSTWNDPTEEHYLPWSIWTVAYATLGVATYLEQGKADEFLIYPVSCAILHGIVALLSLRAVKRTKGSASALVH